MAGQTRLVASALLVPAGPVTFHVNVYAATDFPASAGKLTGSLTRRGAAPAARDGLRQPRDRRRRREHALSQPLHLRGQHRGAARQWQVGRQRGEPADARRRLADRNGHWLAARPCLTTAVSVTFPPAAASFAGLTRNDVTTGRALPGSRVCAKPGPLITSRPAVRQAPTVMRCRQEMITLPILTSWSHAGIRSQ
jgi:hypothetical protein